MLINLLPDFFAILDSTDRITAYRSYFESHRRLLQAYWHNYVIDPDSPHFLDVVRSTTMADRSDLRAMLERTDVVSLIREAEARCRDLLQADVDYDVVLMVGVGAANAAQAEAPALAYEQQVAAARGMVAQDPKRGAQVVKAWVASDA